MMMALTIPLSFHQTAKVLSEGGRCGGVRAVDLRAVNVGCDGVQLLSDSWTGAVRGGSDKLVTSLGKSRVGERNRDGETLGGEARSVAAVQPPGLQIDFRGEADVVVQKLTKLHQHHSKPNMPRVILYSKCINSYSFIDGVTIMLWRALLSVLALGRPKVGGEPTPGP